jgi:type II secretory pathway pseudopilin PulG
MTKKTSRELSLSDVVIPSSFDIRASSFGDRAAFTLLELLVVITIIIALAGLILATVGYVQKKGARSRAEAEMAGMSAALESYKADNGIYPRDDAGNKYTDAPDARSDGSAGSAYQRASQFVYGQLAGDPDFDGASNPNLKSYFTFKPQMLFGPKDVNGNLTSVSYIRDPFGNSYGYSTIYQADPTKGYNPTFDLWSTGGVISNANPPDQAQWIKNW